MRFKNRFKIKECLLFIILLMFMCCHDDPKERISKLVTEWQGKEILFPQEMIFTRYGTDTVDYVPPQHSYRVVVYVDSLGCTSCKLQLPKWKDFISNVDSATHGSVSFLFFFQSKDEKELQYILKKVQFTLPVCIDHEDRIGRKNHFPKDGMFQTFLIDSNNKVKVIGNPVRNLAVMDLYLTELGVLTTADSIPPTSIKSRETECDLGRVKKGTEVKRNISVRNTGNNTFHLKGITTSCECTTASASWIALQPGEAAEVEVIYRAEDKGEFMREVSIFGNTAQEEPLNITITGSVE